MLSFDSAGAPLPPLPAAALLDLAGGEGEGGGGWGLRRLQRRLLGRPLCALCLLRLVSSGLCRLPLLLLLPLLRLGPFGLRDRGGAPRAHEQRVRHHAQQRAVARIVELEVAGVRARILDQLCALLIVQ